MQIAQRKGLITINIHYPFKGGRKLMIPSRSFCFALVGILLGASYNTAVLPVTPFQSLAPVQLTSTTVIVTTAASVAIAPSNTPEALGSLPSVSSVFPAMTFTPKQPSATNTSNATATQAFEDTAVALADSKATATQSSVDKALVIANSTAMAIQASKNTIVALANSNATATYVSIPLIYTATPFYIPPTPIPHNVALRKPVTITANGTYSQEGVSGDSYQEDASSYDAQAVTDGSLQYIVGGSSPNEGVIGFQNSTYNQPMRVQVTINLGARYHIFSIRYNPGNVMRADTWNADTMGSPFGLISTNSGSSYEGAWTEQTGDTMTDSVTINFSKIRTDIVTDWLFIGEVEIYGVPAN